MGCTQSSNLSGSRHGSLNSNSAPSSARGSSLRSSLRSRRGTLDEEHCVLGAKVIHGLAQKKAQLRKDHQAFSFTKIILKFGTIGKVLEHLRIVFQSFEKDNSGTITREGFKQAMNHVHSAMSEKELDELFDVCNMDGNHNLSLREFIVMLAITRLIQAIPDIAGLNESRRGLGKGIGGGGGGGGVGGGGSTLGLFPPARPSNNNISHGIPLFSVGSVDSVAEPSGHSSVLGDPPPPPPPPSLAQRHVHVTVTNIVDAEVVADDKNEHLIGVRAEETISEQPQQQQQQEGGGNRQGDDDEKELEKRGAIATSETHLGYGEEKRQTTLHHPLAPPRPIAGNRRASSGTGRLAMASIEEDRTREASSVNVFLSTVSRDVDRGSGAGHANGQGGGGEGEGGGGSDTTTGTGTTKGSMPRNPSFAERVKWKRIPSMVRVPSQHKFVAQTETEEMMHKSRKEVAYVMDLITAAYLQFDEEPKGYIDRNDLKRHLEKTKSQDGKDTETGFLEKEKWDALAWDSSGRLSFEEFVFTFSHWIDIDEDEEEMEEEEGMEYDKDEANFADGNQHSPVGLDMWN